MDPYSEGKTCTGNLLYMALRLVRANKYFKTNGINSFFELLKNMFKELKKAS